jgi:hypothetical protein
LETTVATIMANSLEIISIGNTKISLAIQYRLVTVGFSYEDEIQIKCSWGLLREAFYTNF